MIPKSFDQVLVALWPPKGGCTSDGVPLAPACFQWKEVRVACATAVLPLTPILETRQAKSLFNYKGLTFKRIEKASSKLRNILEGVFPSINCWSFGTA